MGKRIIACDLDGTLAEYDGWKGVAHIGPEVPSVLRALKQAQEEGAEIWIHTARVSSDEDAQPASYYIQDWLKGIELNVAGITATKHKFFTEFWDDRAIQVIRNSGEFVMAPDDYRNEVDNRMNLHQLAQEQLFTPAEEVVPSALDVQEGGSHYKKYKIQPIEFCHANKIPSLESSIIKYVVRHKDKGGLEDLKKAKHILDILIELEYNK